MAEADVFQHASRGFEQRRIAPRIAPEAEAVAGVRLHGEGDVGERAELRVDARDLERARESLARAPRRGELRHVLAAEGDAAAVRAQVAGQLPDEGRLAGA